MMKRHRAILFFILAFPLFAASQSKYNHLSQLYKYVDEADSFTERSNTTFYLEKYLKDNFNYKESWRYAAKSGRIIYFEVEYIIDSTEYTEAYYIDRGNLVCSEEYEKINYSYSEDELKYGGIYYFESAVPQHMVVLGRKKNYGDQSHPEYAVLSRFEKRYSELKRHIPMLP